MKKLKIEQINQELMVQAMQCKTVEELLAFAEANNIELNVEEAAKLAETFTKTGELSDDELEQVAGGSTIPGYIPIGSWWKRVVDDRCTEYWHVISAESNNYYKVSFYYHFPALKKIISDGIIIYPVTNLWTYISTNDVPKEVLAMG